MGAFSVFVGVQSTCKNRIIANKRFTDSINCRYHEEKKFAQYTFRMTIKETDGKCEKVMV